MTEDIWKITEESELWLKKWIRHKDDGSPTGVMVIVVNGSIELIDGIKKAFLETEGRKRE